MAHRKHLVVMSLLFVLVSCINTPQQLDPIQEATSAPFVLATPVITVSVTEPRTDTPNVKPTPTPFPISTETPISEWLSDEIPSCTNGENPSSIDDLEGMNGVIFYAPDRHKQWYTLAGSPIQEKEIPFPAAAFDSLVFSPDAQWVIAFDSHPQQKNHDHADIQLLGPDGKLQTIELDMLGMSEYLRSNIAPTFSFQNWYFKWVNEQIVLVRVSYSETPDYGFPTYQYALYDIFKQTWRNDLIQDIPDRNTYSWLNISPDLKRVLYRTAERDMALWDGDQKKVVWTLPDAAQSDQDRFVSEWSPDSQFVTLAFLDLMIISGDGNVFRTIKEVFSYEETQFPTGEGHEWSPDSRRLSVTRSFYDELEKIHKSFVYVYDVETDKFIYRCSLDDKDHLISQTSWSPDGKFLVSQDEMDPSVWIRIFDLQNYSVYQYKQPEIDYLRWVEKFPLNLK